MGRKKSVTAEELLGELNSDPEYVADIARIEQQAAERLARLQAELSPVLDDLRRIGYASGTVQDLLRLAPLPDDAVQILLHWLPRVASVPAKETLARTVGAAAGPYPGSPLVECFESTRDESLKFVVANTLFISRPQGVDDWLVRAVESPVANGTRGMLVLALARHVAPGRAMPPLRRIIDELPMQVAEAFERIGGAPERELLQSRADAFTGPTRRAILRAVRKIEERIGPSGPPRR